MFKRIFLALVLVITTGFSLFAVPLEIAPEGVNWIVFFSNPTAIPLSELVSKNPLLPKMPKEMFENFVKATGFNPLSDISSIQLMIQADKPEPLAVVIAKGKFDVDRLIAQVKLLGTDNLQESKAGDLTVYSDKKGSASLVFIDGSTVAGGSPVLLNKFLATRTDKKGNDTLNQILPQVNEKAYFALVGADPNGTAKFMEFLNEQKQKHPARKPQMEVVRNWLMEYFTSGVNYKYIFAQQLDQEFEIRLVYDRPEAKDCKIQLIANTTDPKLFIEKHVRDFLKKLPELTPPPSPEPEK